MLQRFKGAKLHNETCWEELGSPLHTQPLFDRNQKLCIISIALFSKIHYYTAVSCDFFFLTMKVCWQKKNLKLINTFSELIKVILIHLLINRIYLCLDLAILSHFWQVPQSIKNCIHSCENEFKNKDNALWHI